MPTPAPIPLSEQISAVAAEIDRQRQTHQVLWERSVVAEDSSRQIRALEAALATLQALEGTE